MQPYVMLLLFHNVILIETLDQIYLANVVFFNILQSHSEEQSHRLML